MAADADIPDLPPLDEDLIEPEKDNKEEGATQLIILIRKLWKQYVAAAKATPQLVAASTQALEKKLVLYKGYERDLYDVVVAEANHNLIKSGNPAFVSNVFNDFAGVQHMQRKHYPPVGVKYWVATGEIGRDGMYHEYPPLQKFNPLPAAAAARAAPTQGSALKRTAS